MIFRHFYDADSSTYAYLLADAEQAILVCRGGMHAYAATSLPIDRGP